MKDIFNNIETKEKDALIKGLEAHTVNLKKNTELSKILYKNILGIVLSGSVQIIKIDYDGNKSILEDVYEKMVFGSIISSLDSEEISLVAKEDATLLIFDYDHILKFTNTSSKSYIQFLKNVLQITNNEVAKKNIRTEILTKKTIRSRLLTYFETYSKGGRLVLNHTYTELADFLAVDRCAMTRELKNMKEEGVIETRGREITIKMS